MSIGVSVKDEATPELQRKIALLRDKSPFFKRVAIMLHRSVLKNFTAGGRPGKWPKSRRAQLGGFRKDGTFVEGQTLVDTGLLRASIGWKISSAEAVVGMQNVGEVLKGTKFGSVRQGGAAVGAQVNYGYKHQEGIGVKKRPFVLVQVEDDNAIDRMLDEYLA